MVREIHSKAQACKAWIDGWSPVRPLQILRSPSSKGIRECDAVRDPSERGNGGSSPSGLHTTMGRRSSTAEPRLVDGRMGVRFPPPAPYHQGGIGGSFVISGVLRHLRSTQRGASRDQESARQRPSFSAKVLASGGSLCSGMSGDCRCPIGGLQKLKRSEEKGCGSVSA